jgi:hypothetical protein
VVLDERQLDLADDRVLVIAFVADDRPSVRIPQQVPGGRVFRTSGRWLVAQQELLAGLVVEEGLRIGAVSV